MAYTVQLSREDKTNEAVIEGGQWSGTGETSRALLDLLETYRLPMGYYPDRDASLALMVARDLGSKETVKDVLEQIANKPKEHEDPSQPKVY